MLTETKAQSAVWALLAVLVLFAVAAGLVDIYRLYAARNWAYNVAQEAALSGASRGRDWSQIANGHVGLIAASAQNTAEGVVHSEMTTRGIQGYSFDVRVLPSPSGGSILNYPPRPVRLGANRGSWSSNEPAVGVYISMPVNWLLLNSLGITPQLVSVFASAGVAQ
jgi:hypothetical protein